MSRGALIGILSVCWLVLGTGAGIGAVIASHSTFDDTRRWAEAKYGTFDAFEASGTGAQTFDVAPGTSAGVFSIERVGNGDFEITGAESPEGDESSLFTGDGNFTSSAAFGVPDPQQLQSLTVATEDETGEWQVRVDPVSAAPLLPDSGAGTQVYLYDGTGDDLAVDFTGSSIELAQFPDAQPADWSSASEGSMRLREGEHDTWTLAPGPSVIVVESDGDWSLTAG